MKWLSYLRDAQARTALVDGDAMIDLNDTCPETGPELRSALLLSNPIFAEP